MAECGPQPPGGGSGAAGAPSRHEKSLGLLTTKFVSLLQEAKDGVLDLKLVRAPPPPGGALRELPPRAGVLLLGEPSSCGPGSPGAEAGFLGGGGGVGARQRPVQQVQGKGGGAPGGTAELPAALRACRGGSAPASLLFPPAASFRAVLPTEPLRFAQERGGSGPCLTLQAVV